MPARFPEFVRANIPNVSNESIAKLQSLYTFSPQLPEQLAWDYVTDIVFGCSASNIALRTLIERGVSSSQFLQHSMAQISAVCIAFRNPSLDRIN